MFDWVDMMLDGRDCVCVREREGGGEEREGRGKREQTERKVSGFQ